MTPRLLSAGRAARVLLATAILQSPTHTADAADTDAPAARVSHIAVDVVVSSDATFVQTTHAELLATNAAAALRTGQFRAFYDADLQTLDIIDAHTLKKDGRTIAVDPGAIYDQLAPGAEQMPLFSELRMKTIVFPQFEAGDTAVYTLRMTHKEPYFRGAFWYFDLFPTFVAFDDVRETVTAPASMHLKAESYGVSVNQQERDGQTVFSWEYSAPEPHEPTLAAVAQIATMPHVALSSFKDYAALGRSYADAATPKVVVTPQVQALADDLTKEVKTKREQAQKLYEWVSLHIRYVAVELGRGALVPHDAQTVLSNGYGDCKDHTTLLGALLMAKGIASEAVLINSSNNYTVTGVPTFVGFDHVITYLPDFDLYVDSTAMGAPFGVLPFEEYGKPIVHASLPNSRQSTLPPLPFGVATASMKTDATLDVDGVLTGTTATTASGPYGILLKALGLSVQALGPQNFAARVMASLGYGKDATGTVDAQPPTTATPSYTINGRFVAHGWAENLSAGHRFYLPGGMRLLGYLGNGMVGPFGEDSLPADAERPCFNVSTTEEQTLHAPNNAMFGHVPDDTHVETEYLTFDSQWTRNGNAMTVRRTFTTHLDRALCTPAMRRANEKALKTIWDSYNVNVWFEKVEADKPLRPKVELPPVELPPILVPTEPSSTAK